MPSLRRSTGLGPAHSRPRVDASCPGLQRDLPEPGEDPGLDPSAAALADRSSRAGEAGDRLIGAAGPQDLDQFPGDDPVDDPGPAAQRVRGVIDRAVGQ
jgi:hypothetical protein